MNLLEFESLVREDSDFLDRILELDEITLDEGTYQLKVEEWTSECLLSYLEERGEEISDEEMEDDDFWFAVLQEAINHVVREEKYDHVVYIPPSLCGVAYGITVFLKSK